jgi:hypothetical protein
MKRQSIRTIRQQEPEISDTQHGQEVQENENLITLKNENASEIRRKKSEKEKARMQFTTYFTTEQYTKLQRLEIEYLERTGRKIDPNKILRKLVDQASIDNLI